MPEDFLNLPREVRQDILLRSFHPAIKEDEAFNVNAIRLGALDCLSGITGLEPDEICDTTAPHILSWAQTLSSIHEVIEDDMPYVLHKCLEELEDSIRNLGMLEGDFDWEQFDRWELMVKVER